MCAPCARAQVLPLVLPGARRELKLRRRAAKELLLRRGAQLGGRQQEGHHKVVRQGADHPRGPALRAVLPADHQGLDRASVGRHPSPGVTATPTWARGR